MNAVQKLVDAMVDAAAAAHPAIEHTITLSPENSLLLPLDARELSEPSTTLTAPTVATYIETAWCGISLFSTIS